MRIEGKSARFSYTCLETPPWAHLEESFTVILNPAKIAVKMSYRSPSTPQLDALYHDIYTLKFPFYLMI